LSLLSVYFYIKSFKENRLIYWIAFVAFTVLDIYTFFITVFLLVSLDVYYLLFFNKYKKLISKWLVTQVITLFILIPCIIIIFKQILEPSPFSAIAFIHRPSLLTLFYYFQIFNIGFGAPFFIYFCAFLLCLWLFIVGILSIAGEKEERGLLLLWFLLPPFLIYILSFIIRPIFLHRTLIYVTPAYYIILACGIAKIKTRLFWLPLFLFTLLSFVSLRNQFDNVMPLPAIPYHLGVFVKIENKSAAEYIERNFQPGDVIGHLSFYTLLPFIYYHSNKFEEKCVSQIDDYNFRFYHYHSDPIFQHRFSFVSINKFIKGNKRIWLIISSFGVRDKPLLIYPEKSKQAKEWLDKKDFASITREIKRFIPLINDQQ